MNILLLLSYALTLFVYSYSPNRTRVLNRDFEELINRSLGAIFAAIGLFLQRKEELFSIKRTFVFYAIGFLILSFVLLIAFVGNKIDFRKALNINGCDIVASLIYIIIISFCFLYYAGFTIYPFTPNYLFAINILFCLWITILTIRK